MTDARIQRIRSELDTERLDAVVLTNPHDVLYATGYGSILEKWGLQEPLCAAIVPRAGPVVLCLPEANLALLPLMRERGREIRAEELRVFELLNFCEMGRALDPDAKPSALARAAMDIGGERVRGRCESDLIASLASVLKEHEWDGARLGFDDLRVGYAVRSQTGSGSFELCDALDAMVRARIVKTAAELAVFRRIGKVADRIVEFAASRLRPGLVWNELQADIATFMVRNDVTPVDEGAMLFGGAFRGEFIPEIFRTRHDRPLERGQIIILEMLGVAEEFWIDINRTATLGPPSPEYQRLHDLVRDGFLHMADQMRPGWNTADVQRAGFEYLRDRSVPAPEKLVAVLHGVGHMPVEIPTGFPAYGLNGVRGFEILEGMVLSLDYLYFGAKHGPCHMENVFIVTTDGAESTYQSPLELLGPR